MDLTKLTVVGYAESCAGEFDIQLLDDLGRTVKQYAWHDFDKKGKHYLGWCDVSDGHYVAEGEVLFASGKGLWVKAYAEGLSLMCNGQVLTASQSIKLQNNFTMVSNPYPVDVPLLNMWAEGYGESCAGEIDLQTLDELGRTTNMYVWHDFSKKGKDYYGWYDANKGLYILPEDNVLLKAGGAYWVHCNMAEGRQFFLNFPAILQDVK